MEHSNFLNNYSPNVIIKKLQSCFCILQSSCECWHGFNFNFLLNYFLFLFVDFVGLTLILFVSLLYLMLYSPLFWDSKAFFWMCSLIFDDWCHLVLQSAFPILESYSDVSVSSSISIWQISSTTYFFWKNSANVVINLSLILSLYKWGVEHKCSLLNLLLHCQITLRYLLVECHNLEPKKLPQSSHTSFAEKIVLPLYFLPLWNFCLNFFKFFQADYGIVWFLDIVLRHFSLINFCLFCKEIHSKFLLQQCRAFIFFICKYTFNCWRTSLCFPTQSRNFTGCQILCNCMIIDRNRFGSKGLQYWEIFRIWKMMLRW